METKRYSNFNIKAEGDSNTVTGYGAVFGNVDSYGDIIVPGAFAASLAELAASGDKIPMLWQHNDYEPIGVWEVISEDETGLKLEGRFGPTQRAQEAKELIKMGAIKGLSIGYRTIKSSSNAVGNRLLTQLALAEVSIVTFAANKSAYVTGVKAAYGTKTEFEKDLRDLMGLSRSQSRFIVAQCYKELFDENQRKADEIIEEINKEIEEEDSEKKAFEEAELKAKEEAEGLAAEQAELEAKQAADLLELKNIFKKAYGIK